VWVLVELREKWVRFPPYTLKGGESFMEWKLLLRGDKMVKILMVKPKTFEDYCDENNWFEFKDLIHMIQNKLINEDR
jgi:hypothetical protein